MLIILKCGWLSKSSSPNSFCYWICWILPGKQKLSSKWAFYIENPLWKYGKLEKQKWEVRWKPGGKLRRWKPGECEKNIAAALVPVHSAAKERNNLNSLRRKRARLCLSVRGATQRWGREGGWRRKSGTETLPLAQIVSLSLFFTISSVSLFSHLQYF